MKLDIKNFDSVFFEALILNIADLKYCIIGDYENLPHSVSHDIDLWTDNVDLFLYRIKETIRTTGFRVLIFNRTANGANVVFYKKISDIIVVMKIDVMSDTSYKSFLPLVSTKIIEANIKSYKSFYVAKEEIEATMHFLHPLFEWGKIKKEKYKDEIRKNYKTTVFISSLENLFGKKKSDNLCQLIATEKWEQIEKIMIAYKRSALFRFFLKPVASMRFFKLLSSIFSRVVKPSGYVLAFCGLDGAGKTTILNNLNQIFVDVLKQKKVFFSYWRPYLLPELKVLLRKKRKNEDDTPIVMAMNRKPRNRVISIIKLLYYVFDYIFGSLKYIGIRSMGGVVLFDRHYIDTVVFPYRFEMSLPESVFLFFYKLMPKPDFTFFLWATPNEIHNRKIEFTKEEIQQQINDYNLVGSKIKGFVPVETNKTITEEIEKIFFHISLRNDL